MKNNKVNLIIILIVIIVILILIITALLMKIKENEVVSDGENTTDYGLIIDNDSNNATSADNDKKTEIVKHNWTRTGDTFTCSHCNVTYTMGDIVDYAPDGEKTFTTLTPEESGLSVYQTIEVESAEWVVLGIEDADEDRSI